MLNINITRLILTLHNYSSEKYYKETPFMDWLPNKEDWIPLIEK